MDRVAFVFSGQGAQYAGMGKSLYDGSPAAKLLMDTLERIRPGTLAQCFSGSEEVLQDTRHTQPCIFAVSFAAAAALREQGIFPDVLAGFSLGEISALTFGGAFSVLDGFSLVMRRGEWMAQAAADSPGAMAAVLRLSASEVETLAANFTQIYPVNYNAPGQTVVAGDAAALAAFQTAVKEAGGRMVPLKVGGGFHSPYMADASAAFARELSARTCGALLYPVYANLTARPYGEDVAETLVKQMISPVRWQETVKNMTDDGVTIFIEAGPGKTLQGLIRKCTSGARSYHVEDMESLHETIRALSAR